MLEIELVNFLCEKDRYKERPVRRCAVERARDQEDQLLRFVLDPEGRVVADIKRNLPGRGVWITATRDAVAKAIRQKVFARNFRQAISVDDNLAETVEVLLRRTTLQNLALANKAGCVVAGFAKVEAALKGKKLVILLHASDAGEDGRRKLNRLAQTQESETTGALQPLSCFTSDEVSAALGRVNVMHAAITNSGAGRNFIRSVKRFERYVGTSPEAASTADTPEQD